MGEPHCETPGAKANLSQSGNMDSELFSERFPRQTAKVKFEPYWTNDQVAVGLSSGQLLLGQLRINPRSYMDAYISHPKKDADIFIQGTRARNRALNGDIVIVRLEPVKNWKVYDAFVNNLFKNFNERESFVTVAELLYTYPEAFHELFKNVYGLIDNLDRFTDPSNVPGEPAPTLSLAARLPWWQLIQRVGRVVFIERRLHCRTCVGFLRPLTASSSKSTGKKAPMDSRTCSDWKFAMLSPTDSRIPRIIFPKSSCPQDFIRQPETFKLVRFVSRIQDWPETHPLPHGQLMRYFDEDTLSCIEVETEQILINAGFVDGISGANSFPVNAENYVAQWVSKLSTEMPTECARRRDFRSHCVFTVDPRTARDLDDALHVRLLNGDEIAALNAKGATGAMYEVGVHIADVSYFVRPDDPVDMEAASRANTIYLVQLCVPMLPLTLCENLCSLHPGTDKLAFSVVFIMTADAQVLTKWYGRSVIKSRAKLSYEDAQGFLDDPERDWCADDFPEIEKGVNIKEISQSVLLLNKLAEKSRLRRFKDGALQLNQVKPIFTLDATSGLPVGMAPYIGKQANHMVEEWMLMTNEAVAELLAQRLPDSALLRRHSPPTLKQIKEARAVLRCAGIDIEIESAMAIQNSLCRLSKQPNTSTWQHSDQLAELCASMLACSVVDDHSSGGISDEARMLTILNVITKCMNLAEYFCLGSVNKGAYTRHYALNMEHYTHFTSPIRRYADLTVHRQLALILANNAEKANLVELASAYRSTSTSESLLDKKELSVIADYCNARKQDSRKASEESATVFFTVFVKECGPITEACAVVGVLSRSFDVLLLSSGLVRRVYAENLDLKTYGFEESPEEYRNLPGTGVFHLLWNFRPERSDQQPPDASIVPDDPAIHSVVTVRTPNEEMLPPCACFQQKVKLFDVVRCLVSAEEEEEKDNADNENYTDKKTRLPKLVLTLIRPTCAICEGFSVDRKKIKLQRP